MDETDDAIRELADIERQLSELPAEAYTARLDLRERRTELRAAGRRRALADRSTSSLEEALQQLRTKREELAGRRLSTGHVGGGGGPGGGGFEPTVLANLNAEIDEASGVHDVEHLIQQLERELTSRRSDPD